MKTKSEKAAKAGKKGRVKVDKLKLSQETVKVLTPSERKKIEGGLARPHNGCDAIPYLCSVKEP